MEIIDLLNETNKDIIGIVRQLSFLDGIKKARLKDDETLAYAIDNVTEIITNHLQNYLKTERNEVGGKYCECCKNGKKA